MGVYDVTKRLLQVFLPLVDEHSVRSVTHGLVFEVLSLLNQSFGVAMSSLVYMALCSIPAGIAERPTASAVILRMAVVIQKRQRSFVLLC